MQLRYEKNKTDTQLQCYHCGENYTSNNIRFDEKDFCCDGCKLVYELLKDNNLCTYYSYNSAPGSTREGSTYSGKYDYLNHKEISAKLIRFSDEQTTHITFYIPTIHCSSCIWLLENLHRLNHNILSSTVNFLKKEATIIFHTKEVKLSEVVELMAGIGYEPLINLSDLEQKTKPVADKNKIIKIGLAGFCFGNIMMLSFPEYFSIGQYYGQQQLHSFFGYLNLFLSLPVFFYCASGFFSSAWKSIKYKYLTVDAPIALAILVTFSRSAYEILSQTGAGYMDSMTGIVFFMLIGRYFQDKTYETLSFERDYKSYFPVGVAVKQENGKETNVPVSDLKKGNRIIIRNNELIPVDAILKSSQTHVDYSFITGESAPVKKTAGELIYAGGKQLDGAIELETVNLTSQSYLTQLWNKDKQEELSLTRQTFVEKINKYFTIIVLSVAALSSFYWLITDSSKALNALTAVLIVACPCGLLLTTTFVNGNILRILGRNKFYLKNADVIQKLAKADAILFDKTGTITQGSDVSFVGPALTSEELLLITSLAAQSSHPLSRKIYQQFSAGESIMPSEFKEFTGQGIRGIINNKHIGLGSPFFITGMASFDHQNATKVFLSIEGRTIGYFIFTNSYRKGLRELLLKLSGHFRLQLISGDNDAEKEKIEAFFGKNSEIHFDQRPEDKKKYVENLQRSGSKVIMIGDGLNDAGALRQSDVGIAVSDDTNTFSPACDAILDGSSLTNLANFIDLIKAVKKVIVITFIISLTYNIIGLFFAVQGTLSPVIAAILMPASSITIVSISTLSTRFIARLKKL